MEGDDEEVERAKPKKETTAYLSHSAREKKMAEMRWENTAISSKTTNNPATIYIYKYISRLHYTTALMAQ